MSRSMSASVALSLLMGVVVLSQAKGEEPLQDRFDRIAKEVGPVVGIELKEQVAVQKARDDEYRKILQNQVETLWPEKRRCGFVRSMQLLGLFDDKFEFETLLDLSATATSANYDPETKTIQVILGSDKPGWEKSIADDTVFHELVHAAQDQRHDLKHNLERIMTFASTDALMAFRFLLEGEAVFCPTLYRQQMTLEQAIGLSPEAETKVFGHAEPSTSQTIVGNFEQNANRNPRLNTIALAMKQSPPLIVRLMSLPYSTGDNAVLRILKRGGRHALRQSFEDVSNLNTRDLLFPDRQNENPRGVTKVQLVSVQQELGSQWKRIYDDTIGSLTLDTMFEHRGEKANKIASSWNGDRIELWESEDNGVVLLGRIEFETPEAAKLFETELIRLCREMWMRGKTIRELESDGTHLAADAERFIVERRECTVVFLHGIGCRNAASVTSTLWKNENIDHEP